MTTPAAKGAEYYIALLEKWRKQSPGRYWTICSARKGEHPCPARIAFGGYNEGGTVYGQPLTALRKLCKALSLLALLCVCGCEQPRHYQSAGERYADKLLQEKCSAELQHCRDKCWHEKAPGAGRTEEDNRDWQFRCNQLCYVSNQGCAR